MSNQATQEEQLNFGSASVPKLPTLICVGTVAGVGEGHVSKSENYIAQPIQLEALDMGRNITLYLTYRPEWFVAGYQPEEKLYNASTETEVVAGGKSAHFVYGKNIAASGNRNRVGGDSLLRGLAGSDEAFNRLSNTLLRLPKAKDGDGPTIEAVQNALATFFENNVGKDGQAQRIGYILSQQSDKTDEKDEKGKTIYVLTSNYGLSSKAPFFDVTENELKKLAKRAAGSNGLTKMTFSSDGIPF